MVEISFWHGFVVSFVLAATARTGALLASRSEITARKLATAVIHGGMIGLMTTLVWYGYGERFNIFWAWGVSIATGLFPGESQALLKKIVVAIDVIVSNKTKDGNGQSGDKNLDRVGAALRCYDGIGCDL